MIFVIVTTYLTVIILEKINIEVFDGLGMQLATSMEIETPHDNKTKDMNINVILAPLVSLIAGILILVALRLLNYIVAIYLILIALIGLFGACGFHIK